MLQLNSSWKEAVMASNCVHFMCRFVDSLHSLGGIVAVHSTYYLVKSVGAIKSANDLITFSIFLHNSE
jgi:hypothetical protein